MDFFYWDPSGTGGGVEDVNVRIGKLAYAYFHDSSNLNTTNSPTTLSSQIAAAGSTGSSTGQDVSEAYHDLRIYDIPVNKNGLLTAGVDIGQPGGSDTTSTGGAPNHGGFMATIQHNQKTIFADADTNKIAVQYGQGSLSQFLSSGNITDQAGQNSRYKGERIIDYYVGDLSPNWSVGIDGIVEHHAAPVQTCTEANQFNAATGAVTSCTKQTWYSASIRPLYYISDHFALQFDVGHDIVKPDGLPERDMTKFTFAPTLRTGRGWFDRPEIRAFVTYAAWNKAAREAGLVTFNSHGQMTTETAGTSFGIQTEIWW
jgi:maltoporin